jgi:peptidyl-prolyl cis-trans isomerase B (cyclophilin B)
MKPATMIGIGLAVVGVVGIVLAVVLAIVLSGGGHPSGGGPLAAGTTTPTPAGSTTGPCRYTATPNTPAPPGRGIGLPPDPDPTPKTGTVLVTLHTNFGDLQLTLNRAQAPCTVQNFVYLANSQFYENTICHRETAYPTLKVLQCGDPTAQGTGGPGYDIPDEKPTGLTPAPTTDGSPPASIYPRGVVAMANTGQPNSGGSQFFLVYGASQLPPDYTIFGTIGSTGLTIVDTIVSNGIIPGTDPTTGQISNQDGKPKRTVTISQAQVDGH